MMKLKRCPFCGGKASYTDNFYGNNTGHCVFCEDCGAGTAILTGSTPPERLKEMSYRSWNRRVNDLHDQCIHGSLCGGNCETCDDFER